MKDHTVRLPEEKLRERKQIIVDLLNLNLSWSYDKVESVVGKLVHTVHIVPHMEAYMRSFYKWLKDWVNKADVRETPEYMKADLQEWKRCLFTFNSRALIPSPKAIEVAWVGDVSSSFGIGVLVGKCWACFELEEGWKTLNLTEKKRTIAWAETVAIRLGLIVLSKLKHVEGKCYYVWTGNTTSQATVTKRKSRDECVNEEWKHIQRLLTKLACNIKAKRVTSKENVADELSRGFIGELKWFDEVKIDVPEDLLQLLKQVSPPR